jgi:hypothetical protein
MPWRARDAWTYVRHVIEELDGSPLFDAEDTIRAARGESVPSEFPRLAVVA